MPGCCCCNTPRPLFGTIRFWFLPAAGTSGSECTKIYLSIDILKKSYKPRKWFLKHRGENSRKQFADFLKKNYAEALNESSDLTEAYTEK